jgi:hypothetical protein
MTTFVFTSGCDAIVGVDESIADIVAVPPNRVTHVTRT